ncbi:MAG: hypothetical protein JXK05_03100 [Campylobacterales bacterium]|nr:hypothetical protein [Campylobacterales bacterium]
MLRAMMLTVALLSTTGLADFYVIPVVKKGANVMTVKSSGGDYSSPIDAMAAIKDANATNPYTIVMGAGDFDIGTQQLVMKPYVRLVGSGRDDTFINGARVSVSGDGSSALIRGAQGSTLESLSVINTPSTGTAGTVVHVQNATMHLRDLVLSQSSDTVQSDVLTLDTNASVTIESAEILLQGAPTNGRGVFVKAGSVLLARDLWLQNAAAATDSAFGVSATDATLRLFATTIEAGTAGLQSKGLIAQDTSLFCSDVSVQSSDATISYALELQGASRATMEDVTFSAPTDANATAVLVNQTTVSSVCLHCSLSGTNALSVMSGSQTLYLIESELAGARTSGAQCVNSETNASEQLNEECQPL